MIGVSVLYSDPSVHVKKKQSEGSKFQYQPGKELKPGEYLNCKLKLFYLQSQAHSRKTSNFPTTEAISNVDYRSSSILKMYLLLFKDQASFVAVFETQTT